MAIAYLTRKYQAIYTEYPRKIAFENINKQNNVWWYSLKFAQVIDMKHHQKCLTNHMKYMHGARKVDNILYINNEIVQP